MRLLTLFVLMGILSSCSPDQITQKSPAGLQVRETILQSQNDVGIKIRTEIASEPEARRRGLMFREHLPEGEGMLFEFEEEQPLSFWMKNTLIPLDILYFDRNGVLVSVATMTPCTTDHCPGYASARPAKYALEVSSGWVKNNGVGVGWKLLLEE